ncbi:hypothetical protein EVAR_88821_1 [Eumeta japonica]|uniref:Uncharacterized protein n=1 Tax=Eumeta variegata TaxID=151549 RepID=A0A4C1Y7X1_EUMVA|nr:hypothetical protein EVAR_88821_1 [Eumeta japonica]
MCAAEVSACKQRRRRQTVHGPAASRIRRAYLVRRTDAARGLIPGAYHEYAIGPALRLSRLVYLIALKIFMEYRAEDGRLRRGDGRAPVPRGPVAPPAAVSGLFFGHTGNNVNWIRVIKQVTK